jgi:hypothetical protein
MLTPEQQRAKDAMDEAKIEMDAANSARAVYGAPDDNSAIRDSPAFEAAQRRVAEATQAYPARKAEFESLMNPPDPH